MTQPKAEQQEQQKPLPTTDDSDQSDPRVSLPSVPPVPRTVVRRVRRVSTVAGVTDDLVDLDALTDSEHAERRRRIARIVAELEDAKCISLTDAQRTAIVRWLARRPVTLRQITAAAAIIAETETYRSIATDIWATAFATPMVSSRELARQRQAAYAQGRIDERQATSSNDETMTQQTRTLLELEKENARLREQLERSQHELTGARIRVAELGALNRSLIEENAALSHERESLRDRQENPRPNHRKRRAA